MRNTQIWFRISCALAVAIVWLILITLFSIASVSDFKNRHFTAAHQKTVVAEVLFWPIDQSIGLLSADVRFIGKSLSVLKHSSKFADQLSTFVPLSASGDTNATTLVPELQMILREWSIVSSEWITAYKKSPSAQNLIEQQVTSPLVHSLLLQDEAALQNYLGNFTQGAEYVLSDSHRFVIVLQNSDELRATGGFMGSYASIEINHGVLSKVAVQDIYQPDGQFSGFVPAPAGAAEYLSDGKGLRLPDSNWDPDFSKSAQQIMQFFAYGKENQVEGVIAVNLHVAEEVLRLIGPVYLPDYNQTVTAENLSSLARADRQEFFPGSQQKRQFLQALFIQLRIQLSEAAASRPQDFVQLILSEIEHKQIQAYVHSPKLLPLLKDLHLLSNVSTNSSSQYYYLIESNVGINKANRLVTRNVELDIQPTQSVVRIDFQNQNPVTSIKGEFGDYINYQRILVPTTFTVKELKVNNALLTSWDEDIYLTITGEQLKQVGFLVPVPAQASGSAQVTFAYPNSALSSLTIQKQSGLPPTPYQINQPSGSFELVLDKDTKLPLNQ